VKWLIIQSDGQHKGQDDWAPNWWLRECYAIQHAFVKNGHIADIWGLRHPNYYPHERIVFSKYDGLFIIENYEMDWLPDFSKITGPLKVQWIIDAHCQPPSTYAPITAGCDVILQSSRQYVAQYCAAFPIKRHFWFPNGVDTRFFDKASYEAQTRTDNLIFIGGKAEPRRAAIEQMQAQAGLSYSYGVTGLDYIHALLRAKMQFNKGLNGDINYRTFETIALGCCLLTEYAPDLEVLGFVHGKNCLMYRTIDEAVALAKQYLASGWETIAAHGYRLSDIHSYTLRIRDLLWTINLSNTLTASLPTILAA
jgi:hypothetical protein